MTHVTCRLTTKNRDQLRNPTLGNRVWATYTFLQHKQINYCILFLLCIGAVGWAAKRASVCEKLSDGVLAWLSVWSEVLCRLAYGPADVTATHCLLLQ